MVEEYNLDDALFFPDKTYDKLIDGYYIIVAPEYPNWLVLNKNEYRMFCWLREGLSIRSTLENFYAKFCENEKICLDIMTGLLKQIHDVEFSGEAVILLEEPIESIPKKIHIATTNGCNMRCGHCYMSAGMSPVETIDIQKTIQLVKELNQIYGKLDVVVSGGEPLTYKHLEELLKSIKDNDVILFTNGTLISEENIDMIAECCNEVQVSFEGVSSEVYSQVRGSDNYDKVCHALELLKDRGVRIVLAVTVLPNTLMDIQKNLISFIEKMNYNNLEVRLSDEIEMAGNALTMDMSLYKKEESSETVIGLIHKLERMGCVVQKNDIRNTRFTNCGIGTNVVINYDGKIYPCHKLSSYAFDIGTKSSKIIDEFNKVNCLTSNRNIKKCQICELQYICSGGCRIDNYLKTGDMNTVFCDETFKEEQYRRLLSDYKMYRRDVEDSGE